MSGQNSDPYRKDSSIASPATAPARPPPKSGDVVGEKYRVESIIGQGGMGAVFRARHLLTERAVAVKWMLPEVGGEEAVQRFLREARAMGRIDHAGVVGVLDVGVDDGATFLVMELLKGNSLRDMLEARERFEPAEAISLLMPALEGVEAAHRNGVVHRDLKPENIFVVRSGDGTIETTKVLDFGISKLRDDRLEQSPQVDIKKGGVVTRTGVTIGTPSYMSPEQVRGSKDIDARTDVWSLGVILYELLTGHVPFRAESFGALLVAIAVEGYPPLDSVRPDLPAMLVAAVHRALEKEPSVRFRDVASFAAALEPFGAKGTRFRQPDVTRLTDVSPEPPHLGDPAASRTAAGTAVVKPRVVAEVNATPVTRQVDVDPSRIGLAKAAPAQPSIESRGLDLDRPVDRPALGHARTALAGPLPTSDAERPRLPSLPPLDLDAAPPRRPQRVEPAPNATRPLSRPDARSADPRSSEAAPEEMRVSPTTRLLMIGGALLLGAVLLAIGIRVVSGMMREPTPTSPVPVATSEPPPTTSAPLPTTSVLPHRPVAPWPPPATSTGSTTTSGTSLTQPPSVAIEPPPPTTTRSGTRVHVGATTRPGTTPAVEVTAPVTVPVVTTTMESETTMSTEPSGRTGTLSREEF